MLMTLTIPRPFPPQKSKIFNPIIIVQFADNRARIVFTSNENKLKQKTARDKIEIGKFQNCERIRLF